jgi:hypothetical protein
MVYCDFNLSCGVPNIRVIESEPMSIPGAMGLRGGIVLFVLFLKACYKGIWVYLAVRCFPQ